MSLRLVALQVEDGLTIFSEDLPFVERTLSLKCAIGELAWRFRPTTVSISSGSLFIILIGTIGAFGNLPCFARCLRLQDGRLLKYSMHLFFNLS